jgi:hydrogenase maturation protein HypF
MALAYVMRACGKEWRSLNLPLLSRIPGEKLDVVAQMIERGVNSPPTTSLGRLFDAASALAGVAMRNSYEGQAPMEFEGTAEAGEKAGYPFELVGEDGMLVVDADPVIRALVNDVADGVSAGIISARFHNAVTDFLVRSAAQLAERQNVGTVVLSGGCFQNQLLVEGVSAGVESQGLEVLTHSLVPANDGGIALGQAYVAAARLAAQRNGE